MSELKPCPFCGGKATRQVNTLSHGGVTYETGCDNVGCLVLPSAMQLGKSYADNNWNTRADLPPTLSAAMELPEVKALLEALRDMRRQFSPYPSQDTERWREEHEACEHADAALAAIKEPKT